MGEQNNDLTYCELRAKEIINTFDGRRLGRVVDIVFSRNGSDIKGIVVPYERRLFFSRNREIFIPWKCINKIGEDVILVSLKEGPQTGRGGRGHGGHGHGDYGHGDYGHGGHGDYGHGHGGNDCCDDGHKGKDDCGHGEHGHGGYGHGGHGYCDDYGHKGRDDCGCDDKHDKHCGDKPRDGCKGGDRVYDTPHRKESIRCDRKCEKCMLFDCAYRWKC